MPENPIINEEQNQITYNVVLDPGDIARQAEEIRNQIDLALGVGSNAGTQFINTTDFINPQFAPLPQPDFAPQLGGTFDQTFWQKTQEQLSNTYQDLSSGLDRLRQDMSMMADRTSNVIQSFQPATQNQPFNPYENLLPDSFGEYLLGSIGLGGDLSGPIAPSTYKRFSQKNLQEGAEDFLQNPGEAYNNFTSTTPGLLANIAAYIAAPGPMLALDLGMMADEFISAPYNKRKDLAGGIQEIARQQFGNISEKEALGIGDNVLDFVNSFEGYSKDYNLDEVSQNILQFGNMGGFSNVRNVDELQDKITTVVEDTRQIARNLGVFQEEAINIMAELEQKSMVSVEEMRSMSDNMRFYGGVLKQSPTELLQGSVQTAEQFRQAGLFTTPETAMQMHVDANIEAQRLIQSTDPYVQSSVYRLGGQQGTAQSLLNAYAQFSSTPFGNMTNMGQWIGSGTGNIGTNIDMVSGGFTSPVDFIDFAATGTEDVMGKKTLEEVSLDYVELAKSVWDKVLPGEKPTMRRLEGLMKMMPGVFGNLSGDQIRIIMSTVEQSMEDVKSGGTFEDTLEAGETLTQLKGVLEDNEISATGFASALLIKPFEDLGRGISDTWGKFKEETYVKGWQELFGQRTNFETGEIETGLFTGLFNAAFGSTGGTIDIEDITDPEIRKELMLGKNSLYSKSMQNYVKDEMTRKGFSEDTITKTVASLTGENAFTSDNVKFAQVMYKNLEDINEPVIYSHETSKRIDKFVSENMGLIKDKDTGEFLPLENVFQTLQSNITFDDPNLSEEEKNKLIWESLRTTDNKNLKKIMVSREDTKDDGTEIAITLGKQLRDKYEGDVELITTTRKEEVLDFLEGFEKSPEGKEFVKSDKILWESYQKGLKTLDDKEAPLDFKGQMDYLRDKTLEFYEQESFKYVKTPDPDEVEKSLEFLLSEDSPVYDVTKVYGENVKLNKMQNHYKVFNDILDKKVGNLPEGMDGYSAERLTKAWYLFTGKEMPSGEDISIETTRDMKAAAPELIKMLNLIDGEKISKQQLAERLNAFIDSMGDMKPEDEKRARDFAEENLDLSVEEQHKAQIGSNVEKIAKIIEGWNGKMPSPNTAGINLEPGDFWEIIKLAGAGAFN